MLPANCHHGDVLMRKSWAGQWLFQNFFYDSSKASVQFKTINIAHKGPRDLDPTQIPPSSPLVRTYSDTPLIYWMCQSSHPLGSAQSAPFPGKPSHLGLALSKLSTLCSSVISPGWTFLTNPYPHTPEIT